MLAHTAPGLYRQPVMPVRAAGRLSRGDVPVFLGYARRGPVGLPVRVESLAGFEAIFGAAPPVGHLHPALKGFFETGGRTAYVLRLAQPAAAAAAVMLPGGIWRAEASFAWTEVDPRERKREARPDEAAWVQLVEAIFRETGPRSPAPGSWGNGLELRISHAERARTESLPGPLDDPRALALRSLAGLEAHAILALTQTRDVTLPGGRQVPVSYATHVVAAGIDTARQRLLLAQPVGTLRGAAADPALLPQPFDPAVPIQITSVEFDVAILAEGRLEQAFTALAPHPRHGFAIERVTTAAGRSLALVAEGADSGTDWADPTSWPPEGVFRLAGGTDGLEGIGRDDYLAVLPRLARLDEVALIAAPDLVLQAQAPPPAVELPAEPVDCCDLSPPQPQLVTGRVMETRHDGGQVPVAGVEVDVLGPGGRTRTDQDGIFTVPGVAPGLVTVRLARPGFEPLEAQMQSARHRPLQPVTLALARLTLPRALAEDEILEVGQALADPARVGPYKIAVLDPPRPDAVLDDLRSWRARLGGSMRIGFFAPWLRLPSTDGSGEGPAVPCPPSGHVCGAFAAAEHAEGIHRTGANLPLRFVEGVMLEIDDAAQGVLNPVGINAVRAFPGRGIRAYGTRTLSADPEWRHLTARRVVDAIEKTLERALHWMVFEPNNVMTRHAVAQTAAALLDRIWRDGVLAGSAAEEAFAVKCDLENNPPDSREAGQLVVDIAVAPTTPFEFVLFRLGSGFDAPRVTEAAR